MPSETQVARSVASEYRWICRIQVGDSFVYTIQRESGDHS